jgi:hypothetical protein
MSAAPRLSPHQTLALLRRRLPLSARMRPVLLERAKAAAHDPLLQPICRVTNIYETEPGLVICHLEYVSRAEATHLIVAPLSQVSFGRGHPLTKLLAPLCEPRRTP